MAKKKKKRNRGRKIPDWLNVVIPIVTFILGFFCTIFVDNYKQNRSLRNEAANNIAESVNEWHNQLYELKVEKAFVNHPRDFSKRQAQYNQNREVLPKLLRNLEIIKTFKSCDVLTEYVVEFLSLVSDYDIMNGGMRTTSCALLSFDNKTFSFDDKAYSKLSVLLRDSIKNIDSGKLDGSSQWIYTPMNEDSKDDSDFWVNEPDWYSPTLKKSDSLVQKINIEAARIMTNRRRKKINNYY